MGSWTAQPAVRLAALVTVVLWGLISHSTYVGSGDEPHYLAIAHSLAFDRDLQLGNNYGPAEPLIAGGGLQPDGHVQRGRDGELRPLHDIGLPALFVPWVAVTKPLAETISSVLPDGVLRAARLTPSTLYRHLISTGMILLTATLAVSLRRLALSAGVSPRLAFWGTALVILSPPILIFGVLFFTEVLSALLVSAVVLLMIAERRTSIPATIGTGIAIGVLPLVHVRNSGLAVVLTILAMWTLWRGNARRQCWLLGVIVACGAAARVWLNWYLWGTLLTTPHARLDQDPRLMAAVAEATTRAMGMLVDQEFGLLPYLPIAVLAVWGWTALSRRNLVLARSCLLVAVVYIATVLLPYTNAHGWTGGWSPPARFLVPILPLLGLLILCGLSAAPRWVSIPLIVLQLGVSGYFFSHPKNLWNDGDGVAAVCERGGANFCWLLPSFVIPEIDHQDSAPPAPDF